MTLVIFFYASTPGSQTRSIAKSSTGVRPILKHIFDVTPNKKDVSPQFCQSQWNIKPIAIWQFPYVPSGPTHIEATDSHRWHLYWQKWDNIEYTRWSRTVNLTVTHSQERKPHKWNVRWRLSWRRDIQHPSVWTLSSRFNMQHSYQTTWLTHLMAPTWCSFCFCWSGMASILLWMCPPCILGFQQFGFHAASCGWLVCWHRDGIGAFCFPRHPSADTSCRAQLISLWPPLRELY